MVFNSRWMTLVLVVLTVSMSMLVGVQAAPPKDAAAVEFFEKKIRPLLAESGLGLSTGNGPRRDHHGDRTLHELSDGIRSGRS